MKNKQEHFAIAEENRILTQYPGLFAKMNELSFLFKWVREADFCGDLDIDILRILWTAYCFHNGLDVDTAEYDNVLLCIYNSIVPNDSVNVLMTYDEFDAYMAHYLV